MSKPAKEWRVEVRAAIQRRGRRKYDVWTGYAPKGGFYFSLDGTPNYLHLLWMEGDSNIISYTIPTERQIGQGREGPQGTVPDAICVLRTGEVEWREVKTDADADLIRKESSDQILAQTGLAEKYGVKWRLVTMSDLNKHDTLIQNWREGLGYIWAALDFDLAPFEYNVRFILGDMPKMVSQVLAAYKPDQESLLLAAIFRLVQKGEIGAELSRKAFGLGTVLYPRIAA